MKMYVLEVGELCLDYWLITPGADDGERVHVPLYSFLIETDLGEALLVDTGPTLEEIATGNVSRRHNADEFVGSVTREVVLCAREEDYLLRQLALLDVYPNDVKHVVNTHYALGHAGNNLSFPNATFYVHDAALAEAEQAAGHPAVNELLAHGVRVARTEDGDEIVPGVRVLHTPGHGPFQQSVSVDLPESGLHVLCGDAIPSEDSLRLAAWANHGDPANASASAARLQALSDEKAGRLVYGHDVGQARSLRRAPFAYV